MQLYYLNFIWVCIRDGNIFFSKLASTDVRRKLKLSDLNRREERMYRRGYNCKSKGKGISTKRGELRIVSSKFIYGQAITDEMNSNEITKSKQADR